MLIDGLLKYCCDPSSDEFHFTKDSYNRVNLASHSPVTHETMFRRGSVTPVSTMNHDLSLLMPAQNNINDIHHHRGILSTRSTLTTNSSNSSINISGDHDDVGTDCCRPSGCPPNNCNITSSTSNNDNHSHGLRNQQAPVAAVHNFFRRLGERWRTYDSFESFSPTIMAQTRTSHNHSVQGSAIDTSDIFRRHNDHEEIVTVRPRKIIAMNSPLRQAHTYDDSTDVPTISPDEIVLPGSLLQQEMAKKMLESIPLNDVDECVLCMEGFDETNPRMPTLCGCGENRTYFHLPCLYQWIEKSNQCPTCREPLTWEEF